MAKRQQVYIYVSSTQMKFKQVTKRQFQELMEQLQNIHQNFVVKMELTDNVQFNKLIVL